MMNLRELTSRLAKVYDYGEARAVLRLVMECAFHLTWTDVLGGEAERMTPEVCCRLENIMQRLEQGEPVQYVLGEAVFCDRTFHVGPGVLIPRPETELLVQECLSCAPEATHSAPFSVLDIGTGSGCIATTIALERPECTVFAWDISAAALRIATDNADRLGAGNVTFSRIDILDANIGCSQKYDIIVSNPPYICEKERNAMDRIVTDHEPEEALFVPDDDPLRFYNAIAVFARRALNPGGRLFFEVNSAYYNNVERLLRKSGFAGVEVKKDQFGNYRIVGGHL